MKYLVEVPFVTRLSYVIEAKNREEALQKAECGEGAVIWLEENTHCAKRLWNEAEAMPMTEGRENPSC